MRNQESNQLEYIARRLIDTHDTQDREIKKGVSFVIFAWGEGEELSYHGSNRGTVGVSFFHDENPKFVPLPPIILRSSRNDLIQL